MTINRRRFLTNTAFGAAGVMTLPQFLALAVNRGSSTGTAGQKKAYGSGYFGEWIEDKFGLPAFHYTCDQANDPKAVTEMNPGVLSSTEHIFQVGNDRLVAVASNYGHVRVRQDEGAPKFLNDHAPDRGCYAGGFGYLSDSKTTLSTLYPGASKSFDRIFGCGYFRKKVSGGDYSLDQVIFAPFGDDPVLISQVTIRNQGNSRAQLRWIECWGCQPYQFSFRSFMESFAGRSVHDLRRDFAARFTHHFEKVANGAGLLEKKVFLGRAEAEDRQFKAMVAFLEKSPNPFLKAPEKNLPEQASFDDLHPPSTFLISLDAPADGMSTNGKDFFGASGADSPVGLYSELDGDVNQTGPESALLLERKLTLAPGASRTLSFMYGYLPNGADLNALVGKYRSSADRVLETSSARWKKSGLRFSTESEPWVEREATWNHYSLRSGITADDFFSEHIVSQASIYQYVMGFQGAARDPLQHALPFIFSDPGLVKEVMRYTLREVRPDGSIPYGIVGHGVPMPTKFDYSSDMPMWLIWAVSEYVLATRDAAFLDSDIALVYGTNPGKATVRALLERCYRHLVKDVGTGEHGLMRMLHDDWNDALVSGWVPAASLKECLEKGESVLNSAMAAYVFDYYARMLAFAGEKSSVMSELQQKAAEHRNAVRKQWSGKWFRRAWLGPTMGWLGEKGLWIEPQPWAIISGACNNEQTHTLVESLDQELRRPSPIGAIQISDSPDRVGKGLMKPEPGTSVAGGVWPSLNQTLIWALARVDGGKAWNEWKKNSFAKHADVYPDIWYGTWSGPDVLNSALSKQPGETTHGKPFGWTDFPVLNMHTHACPLYSAAKLLGLEFAGAGVTLAPRLPLESFRFDSPLLGVVKTIKGYEGWYDPSARNTWGIRLSLGAEELKRFRQVEVNGKRIHARRVDSTIELKGEGGNGKPLRWSVQRG